jgi:cell division protein FtsX
MATHHLHHQPTHHTNHTSSAAQSDKKKWLTIGVIAAVVLIGIFWFVKTKSPAVAEQKRVQEAIKKNPELVKDMEAMSQKMLVLFKPGTPKSRVDAILKELTQTKTVKVEKYITEEEAYENFRKTYQNDKEVLSRMKIGMLPASVILNVSNEKDYDSILNKVSKYPEVMSVKDNKDEQNDLQQIKK